MLELIKQELIESRVTPEHFISINFEDMNYSYLQTAKALHEYITQKADNISGKVYLFFDEVQEVSDWEKCINSFRVSLDCDIYITGSNANYYQVNLLRILEALCRIRNLSIFFFGIYGTISNNFAEKIYARMFS